MLVGSRILSLCIVLATVAGCATGATDVVLERSADAVVPATAAADDVAPTTVAPPPPPPETETAAAVTPAAAPTTTAAPLRERVIVDTGYSPFALAGSLVLLHPAAQVERIGFHEAGHDGAQDLAATTTAARPIVLETRNRGTAPQTAADIVVAPETDIVAPVTGTVLRAGDYTLYCHHTDSYAVIEPDGLPGWEVKVLHISGLHVQAGQRVDAGVTLLAAGPTVLPFESQVDEFTGEPSWPHVHVEVVDTSIPNRPPPGGGGPSC